MRSIIILWAGSSVGIVTDYGLDGLGIESRWGRDFPPVQTGPGAHPASCTMGKGSFPAYCGLMRGTDHPPLSIASRQVTWCSSPHLLHIGACNLPPSTVVQDALSFTAILTEFSSSYLMFKHGGKKYI